MFKFAYPHVNATSPAPQFSLAHSHAARAVDPDDFIDDVADVMAGANDDEWKEMIAEEIRHINAHKGEEGIMLDEDERFIGGGEGGIGIMAGDEDGENRKTLLNWQHWRNSPNQVCT